MTALVDSGISEAMPLVAGDAFGLNNPEQLVRTHAALIKRIARSVFIRMSSATPVEDLTQIGSIALLEAARTFEDRGTTQFATYAGIRIRGAMIDELRRSATVSRRGLQNRRRFAAARANLTGSLGRSPTDAEMAESLQMTVADYRSALSGTQSLSFESIDSGYSEYDSSYADDTPGALDQLEKVQFRQELTRAIAELAEHQRMILQLYFIEELDLTTIGRLMNVGPARVCQLKKVALETLRRRTKDWHP